MNIDYIRKRQKQRLSTALESWDEAKKQLEIAIALAESKEREFREVSEDVQRRLDALELVIRMADEVDDRVPAERNLNSGEPEPVVTVPEDTRREAGATEEVETPVHNRSAAPASHGFFRRSSRPLFPSGLRSA